MENEKIDLKATYCKIEIDDPILSENVEIKNEVTDTEYPCKEERYLLPVTSEQAIISCSNSNDDIKKDFDYNFIKNTTKSEEEDSTNHQLINQNTNMSSKEETSEHFSHVLFLSHGYIIQEKEVDVTNMTKEQNCIDYTNTSLVTHITNQGFEKCVTGYNLSENITENPNEMGAFRCDLCPFKTLYKQCLVRHKILHKNETQLFSCDICNFKTKYKFSLTNHLATNKHKRLAFPHDTNKKEDDIKLQCELCSYVTSSRNNFSKHKATHNLNLSDLPNYKCIICPYETKRKNNMNNHILTHKTKDEVSLFKCQLCPFQTKYKSCISTHLLTHKTSEEVRMYKCNNCTYQAKYKKSLNRHILKSKCAERVRNINGWY